MTLNVHITREVFLNNAKLKLSEKKLSKLLHGLKEEDSEQDFDLVLKREEKKLGDKVYSKKLDDGRVVLVKGFHCTENGKLVDTEKTRHVNIYLKTTISPSF